MPGPLTCSTGPNHGGVYVLAVEPVALRLEGSLSGSSEIIVEQGKSFGIRFSCVDAKGEPAVLGGSPHLI